MDQRERRRRQEIMRRRRRQALIRRAIVFGGAALVLILFVVIGVGIHKRSVAKKEQIAQEEADRVAEEERKFDELVAEADFAAAQYDYDKAINLIKALPDYASDERLASKITSYEATKSTCQPWPIDDVPHVFYHTLIKDTTKAFDGDDRAAGYNQFMTTIDEFNKITQSMYDKGYVLVSLKDISPKSADGTMTKGQIMLPPGKKPYVVSQDDVSYYHYMDGDGFAARLVLDENGEVKNEYIEDDGSITIGDFDMVPLLDSFVKKNPDASYRGAKGILAMTGYNGLLGYRTDISYETKIDLDSFQTAWLEAHPDFSLEKERADAKAVADVMKADGWEFASHTWGHMNATNTGVNALMEDWGRWKESVTPVLGEVDTLILAFGADIGGAAEYEGDKFNFYKSEGIDYYCNVNGSAETWEQFHPQYYRQGRQNLDGYRMWYNPDRLMQFYDVEAVFDPARPTPVEPL